MQCLEVQQIASRLGTSVLSSLLNHVQATHRVLYGRVTIETLLEITVVFTPDGSQGFTFCELDSFFEAGS